ncbi:chemotaxis protein CheB [Methanocella sp. CWC-04]|uniref:protein-glutamate methylesterase n=1 Tax=Methanooceanicella nereidis TaxID=2052831 RepID=A0AAP2W7N1_9EURY|nr:chemotaxis protein CheB [Methanocella sp. CWC-04]MCD1295226.1 chemotaxis protein CheB [Methanocella sp. CWC-04]
MSQFDIVAIGTSAGGLKALTEVLSNLPKDFPVPILIVQHLDPRHKSLMAEILQRHSDMNIKEAEDGEDIKNSTVYIAPPNRHMLTTDKKIELTKTEFVHFSRPSIDLLFDSVAADYKDRAIAVILTGSGMDGAIGIKAIKENGGTTIAQDSRTSEYFSMPDTAIKTGSIDFILPLNEIAGALVKLVTIEPGEQ